MRAALLISAALIFSPAYAQNAANDQLQLRGVSALAEIEIGHTRDAAAASTAAGNSVSGVNDGQDAAYSSSQHMDGDASAETNAIVWHADGVVSVSSAALGNGLTAQTSNGALELDADQRAHGAASASTRFTGADAGDAATSASAASNVAAITAQDGDLSVRLMQESAGAVSAAAEADHCCVAGQAVSAAIASANNATYTGTTTTSLSDTRQAAHGSRVSARTDLYAGYTGDASANASATANTLTINNQWGYANARARQDASADVAADSYVTLGGDFLGFASAGAYGVGNSVTATNVGSDMALDIAQNNAGDISANAALLGEGGDAAIASSAAYGNSISAGLCGDCDQNQPALTATTQQQNDGDVRARASVAAPRARSAAASATAIGNAATFQATGPGG